MRTLCGLMVLVVLLPASAARADDEEVLRRLETLEQRVRALEAELARLRGPAETAVLRAHLDDASSVAAVDTVLSGYALASAADYRAAIEKLETLGPEARPRLLEIARRFVEGPGGEDAHARALLGYRRFEHGLVDIGFEEHSFLMDVELANRHRWFGRDEERAYQRALEAARHATAYQARITRDPFFRAADQLHSHLALSPRFREYHLIAHVQAPFLVCHAVRRTVPRDAELTLPLAQRAETLRALEARHAEGLAARAARLLPVYDEMREVFGGRRLEAPWGGLPDLPAGRRSFADGFPQSVVVFDRAEDFAAVTGGPTPENSVGLAAGNDQGSALVHDAGDGEGPWTGGTTTALMLLQSFGRQQARWREYKAQDDVFSLGAARHFGLLAVGEGNASDDAARAMAPIRELSRTLAERAGLAYPVMPLDVAVQFTTPAQAAAWLSRTHQVPAQLGKELFHQQALALTSFLLGQETYRERYLSFLQRYLVRGAGRSQAARLFRSVFELDEHDGRALEAMEADYAAFLAGFIERPADPDPDDGK